MREKIIFLVRAGRIFKVSFGHLFRSIQIYEQLKKIKKIEPLFIINKNKKSERILKKKKIQFITSLKFEKKDLLKKITKVKSKKIIIDTYDFANSISPE